MNLGAHLVGGPVDGGSKVDLETFPSRAEVIFQRLKALFQDSLRCPSPAGVEKGHQACPGVHHKDRNTVGQGHREEDVGFPGRMPIAGRRQEEPRRQLPMNPYGGAVELSRMYDRRSIRQGPKGIPSPENLISWGRATEPQIESASAIFIHSPPGGDSVD